MSARSKIEWTDRTWNPVTGCTKVSPGCDNCYAERFAERFRGVPGHPFEHGFDIRLHPERLEQPFFWRTPSRVFVNSMSDLFHRDVPNEFIVKVFDTMYFDGDDVFQVLTKRPERTRRFVPALYGAWRNEGIRNEDRLPIPNVWLGVSVESNEYAWRADMLRESPAAVRFLSLEPLLGPVDKVSFEGIHWVIVGGESGPRARPMQPEWARDVRDRCAAAGIPFFFKQWGGVRKKETGRELDGRTHDEFPAAKRNEHGIVAA
jgi:protein gp37